ncbi:MAG: UbiX family flavin prenyltransferase [Acidobacteriota bacterium]
MRIIVGITGASGAIYGVRLVEKLRRVPGTEIHLVMTRSGERTLFLETGKKPDSLRSQVHASYPIEDIGAALASGSFLTEAMVVAPCSVRTLGAIASCDSSNLLLRAADVTLKEHRRLVLMFRETPLHLGHLRAMAAVTEMGAIVAPPVPGFYFKPQTVMDLVDHSVDRVLDLIGLPAEDARRWPPETR